MKELKKILEQSLVDDSCMSVTIHCNIPKLNLIINDSRQMLGYGIGLDRQQGFTLSIWIDKNSNKGKKLKELLNENNFLTEFKAFEAGRSVIYLKDFRREIELLERTIHHLLGKINKGSSGQFFELTATRTDGTFRLE
ncbi:MAG: hypothetical protein HOP30_22035 [Cyclobacteriaceae bacterium]|nr:hypothetical protein [Cyclobacteriaceae bacterium]